MIRLCCRSPRAASHVPSHTCTGTHLFRKLSVKQLPEPQQVCHRPALNQDTRLSYAQALDTHTSASGQDDNLNSTLRLTTVEMQNGAKNYEQEAGCVVNYS